MSENAAALLGDNGAATEGAGATTTTTASTTAATTTQGGAAPWYGQVDEATSAYITNKGWDNPVKAIESYRNLEKFAGGSKNLLEVPGPDAEQAKLDEFYNQLGRPDAPEKYDLKVPEGGDPALTDWFKQTAHKHGLTTKQAGALFSEWNAMSGEKMQSWEAEARQQSERSIGELKKEWGQGFDKQIDMGKRAVAALGFDQTALSAYEAKLGTADMLKLFAKLGSKMGEDSFEDGNRGGGSGFGTTPAEAKQQIADLKTDKQFMDAYMKGNPEHVSKMRRLMEAANA